MPSTDSVADLIRRVLLNDAHTIRRQFTGSISPHLEHFVAEMATALRASSQFDAFAKGDEGKELVGSMIFSAVQGHLIAMRLFLDGFVVQSGNAERQVLESMALAILFSKPQLPYRQKFLDDEFTANRAVQTVLNQAAKLGVVKSAVIEMKKMAVFYHLFSHPSKMTLALYRSYAQPERTLIGGIYDETKLQEYRNEALARVRLARIMPSFIGGVMSNLQTSESQSTRN